MSDVKIAVVGVGGMGGSHARRLLKGEVPGAVLSAVCDTDASVLKKFPEVPGYGTADELLAAKAADAVIVATPHYDHTTIGVKVLEAGLHLLVEKPISVHKRDCEKLIAAHKGGKQVFSAMFNQRTDPHYTKLKNLIETGQLGKINRVNWIITNWFRSYAYYASGGWRATWGGEGGGVLLNQCPHQLDLYQWLFGMPDRVRAFCHLGKFHDIEVEDDVTAYMEYDNGCTGVFITTTGEAPGTNRLEIAAENGRIIIEHGTGIQWMRNEQPTTEYSKVTKERFGRPPTWDIQIPANGSGEQHLGILKNFVNAIAKGEKLIAPAGEGIHSVELANAMLYSSARGETVDLPLDSAAYARHLQSLIDNSTFVKKTDSGVKSDDLSGSF